MPEQTKINIPCPHCGAEVVIEGSERDADAQATIDTLSGECKGGHVITIVMTAIRKSAPRCQLCKELKPVDNHDLCEKCLNEQNADQLETSPWERRRIFKVVPIC